MTARLTRVGLWTLAVLLGLALIWSAGFMGFISVTETMSEDEDLPAHADGIVALTGGAGRVERALRLLAEGRADRLLISGVGRAEFPELAARAGVDVALAPRVTLGHAAANTRGNAQEAAEWAQGQAIRSVIVVTSAYHMPRAMAELRRALPGYELHSVAVLPPGERGRSRLRLLAGEYTKFLAAEIGLSRLDPTR